MSDRSNKMALVPVHIPVSSKINAGVQTLLMQVSKDVYIYYVRRSIQWKGGPLLQCFKMCTMGRE